ANWGSDLQGNDDPAVVTIDGLIGRAAGRVRVVAEFGQQVHENWIRADIDLAAEPLIKVRAPLSKINNARRKRGGTQAQTKKIHRRPQQRRVQVCKQWPNRL